MLRNHRREAPDTTCPHPWIVMPPTDLRRSCSLVAKSRADSRRYLPCSSWRVAARSTTGSAPPTRQSFRRLGRTWRLVTSAALILFLAFLALGAAPNTDPKVFATALGVGILLDATVVRALLVPALVSLFGRWNWWLPAGVARVLRVEPSPLPPKALPPATPEPVLERV